jgi:hypothetical protein
MGSLSQESTTIPARGRDGLDFTAIGGKRQGREVPLSLRVEPGAKHPVWKTRSIDQTGALPERVKLYLRVSLSLISEASSKNVRSTKVTRPDFSIKTIEEERVP